jgi:sporulation protein YlmC with PRC-barrel domain
MSEGEAGASPGIAEALGWAGFELDDVDGRRVGRVRGVYVDAADGDPIWLVVAIAGRRIAFARRGGKNVVVPLRECAATAGRVWTAQRRETMRHAPPVDPTRPLLREHEVTICGHYGIGERIGRHAEIAGRAAGSVTAQPA